MSRIGDILIDIQERLAGGQSPEYIAGWLGIPIEWVTQVETEMFSDWSDYARINEDPGHDQT